MNTKILSDRAFSVIEQYLHFAVGGGKAVCSVPYFNNKTVRARAALRVEAGKGSPKEIFDETRSVLIKNHIYADSPDTTITGETLKKILTDNNIGIDCSGFAYHVLNAESEASTGSPLDKHLSFSHIPSCSGIVGRIRCALRPIENCSVGVFASDTNSTIIKIDDIRPGDIITMLGGPDASDRDHILVIHQVDYQNFKPIKIFYSHSVAYPEDGVYGTGIKQGTIEICDWHDLFANIWTENGATGASNRICQRAKASKTEIRRLKSLQK